MNFKDMMIKKQTKAGFLTYCYHLRIQKNICEFYGITNSQLNEIFDNHFPGIRYQKGCKDKLPARIAKLYDPEMEIPEDIKQFLAIKAKANEVIKVTFRDEVD